MDDIADIPFDADRPSTGSATIVRDVSGAVDTRPLNLYFDEVLRGSEVEAWRSGFVLLVGVGRGETAHDTVRDMAGRVDGLIVLAGSASEEELGQLARRIPVVVMAGPRRGDALDHVSVSNTEGMHALVTHLLDDLDVTDLVYVAGSADSPDDLERWDGFRSALLEHGITPPDEPQLRGDFTRDGGRRAGRELLARPTLPRAVVCANDQMALGVIDAARIAEIAVPDALIVTGFDGIDAGRLSTPRLTTVRQPMELLGRAAVQALGAPARRPGSAGDLRETARRGHPAREFRALLRAFEEFAGARVHAIRSSVSADPRIRSAQRRWPGGPQFRKSEATRRAVPHNTGRSAPTSTGVPELCPGQHTPGPATRVAIRNVCAYTRGEPHHGDRSPAVAPRGNEPAGAARTGRRGRARTVAMTHTKHDNPGRSRPTAGRSRRARMAILATVAAAGLLLSGCSIQIESAARSVDPRRHHADRSRQRLAHVRAQLQPLHDEQAHGRLLHVRAARRSRHADGRRAPVARNAATSCPTRRPSCSPSATASRGATASRSRPTTSPSASICSRSTRPSTCRAPGAHRHGRDECHARDRAPQGARRSGGAAHRASAHRSGAHLEGRGRPVDLPQPGPRRHRPVHARQLRRPAVHDRQEPTYWQADKVAAEHIILPATNTQLDVATKGYDWAYSFISDVDGAWVGAGNKNTYWFPPGGTVAPVPEPHEGAVQRPQRAAGHRRSRSTGQDRRRLRGRGLHGCGRPDRTSCCPTSRPARPLDSRPGLVTQNQQAALEYFAQAGYTQQGGKLVDAQGTQLSFTITTANGYNDWLKGVQEVQKQLGRHRHRREGREPAARRLPAGAAQRRVRPRHGRHGRNGIDLP